MAVINDVYAEKWIPVKEKLPEIQDEYLVTWEAANSDRRYLQMLEYDIEDGQWILETYMESYKDVKIIAWMPLPQCYQGEV